MTFYALFNTLYSSSMLAIGTIIYLRATFLRDVYCALSVWLFVCSSFIQPIVVFRTLQLDSQYWQGLHPAQLGADSGSIPNPLREVWDSVGLATAQSMATSLHTYCTSPGPADPADLTEDARSTSDSARRSTVNRTQAKRLPIIHFGLIHIDPSRQCVAGGFSRVYFGHMRTRHAVPLPAPWSLARAWKRLRAPAAPPEQQRVALKMLYAMELTPPDVADFYREANMLAALQHECVVRCFGICVMPPMLIHVLEHCRYGSLFDFIHTPAASLKDVDDIQTLCCEGRTLSDPYPLFDLHHADIFGHNAHRVSVTVQQPDRGSERVSNMTGGSRRGRSINNAFPTALLPGQARSG